MTVAQRLNDKVAIVTGAGQGIGAAIARQFATEGATVVIAERDHESGERVADDIVSDGNDRVMAQRTDISDPESVAATVETTVERYGRVDVLVNNAGIAVFNEPLATTKSEWDDCMAVDLEGAWNCCRAVLPHMLKQRTGAIINIASNHTLQVIKGTFPYPVAKHALIGLTRSLALEYADRGVAVNAISPGYIDTPLAQHHFDQQPDAAAYRRTTEAKQPLGRLGRPEEVAALAVLLASEEARFIIGANLVIDGGVSIRMYE